MTGQPAGLIGGLFTGNFSITPTGSTNFGSGGLFGTGGILQNLNVGGFVGGQVGQLETGILNPLTSSITDIFKSSEVPLLLIALIVAGVWLIK
jgi:hypothetical protein